MKKTDPPIIVRKMLSCPIETAWNAITDKEEMLLWYFENIPEFKPEVGFKTQFVVQSEDRTFTHMWEVTAVIKNKLITYNWQYPEYPGESKATFLLVSKNGKTEISVITDVLQDFPSETVSEFKRESCQAGWNYFLDRLVIYIESK